jgi:hypothetical protein
MTFAERSASGGFISGGGVCDLLEQLDAGAVLGRAAATVQRRGGDLRLALPAFLVMCASGVPSPDRPDALAYAFAYVDLPEVDAESHAGESITGDLMTEAW